MDSENQIIRILFAEDLPADAELARRAIKKEKIHFESKVVDTEADFRNALAEFHPDIVVSDYSMPPFDGMTALKITRSLDRYIPFIVLTGSLNEETAVACMKAGANDYVLKEQIKRLPFSITEAIMNNRSRQEKENLGDQLKLLSRSVEQNPVAIVITNPEGSIDYVNPAFTKITGYSLAEIQGKNPRVLKSGYHSEDFYQNLWKTLLSGKDWEGELKNRKKSGETYWEQAIISPILLESKRTSPAKKR